MNIDLIENNRVLHEFWSKPRISIATFLLFLLLALSVPLFSAWLAARYRESISLPTYSIGQEIRTDTLTATVNGFRRDTSGDGSFAPKAGHEFAIVNLTFKNDTATSIELVPLLHVHLRDAAGRVYQVSPVPSDTNQWSGTLLPHDLIREDIGFEVIKSSPAFVLYIETGYPKREIVAVNIR
jgi:hypothetical protein